MSLFAFFNLYVGSDVSEVQTFPLQRAAEISLCAQPKHTRHPEIIHRVCKLPLMVIVWFRFTESS